MTFQQIYEQPPIRSELPSGKCPYTNLHKAIAFVSGAQCECLALFVMYSLYLDNYAGLEKVIEILRRAGKLEECTKFLDMAEKSSGRASIDAGFNYCKGLYEWSVCRNYSNKSM